MIIQNLPFYWRATTARLPPHHEIPTRADFSFDAIGLNSFIMQVPAHDAALEIAYQQPFNVGYLRADFGDDRAHFQSFWEFITGMWGARHDDLPLKAVDVGAGHGHLAEALHRWNGESWGVEPSPLASCEGAHVVAKIEDAGTGRNFDIITHHHVLEHVEDPVNFLRDLGARLSPRGMMILAVPDCSPSILSADISMALHQHRTYFSTHGLYDSLTDAGLELLALKVAPMGGTIYAACVRAKVPQPKIAPNGFNMERWERRAYLACSAFSRAYDRALIMASRARKSIGFYCPLRAFPYLAAIGQLDNPALRFFDDGLAGCYLDGVLQRMEGIADMTADPPHTVFVMAWGAEQAIVDRLVEVFATAADPPKDMVLLRKVIGHV